RLSFNPFQSYIFYVGTMYTKGSESRYKSMDRQPGNMHWLINNNDRQQTRPGQEGRPNGQGAPQRRRPTLNGWLMVLVGIMLELFIYNYINNANQTSTAPQRIESSYN